MREVELPNPRRYVLSKEIRLLMYGFGDDPNVDDESVELMEEYLVAYIENIASRATAFTSKPKASDFLRVIRSDRKKVSRANQLLRMDKELKNARALLAEPMEGPGGPQN